MTLSKTKCRQKLYLTGSGILALILACSSSVLAYWNITGKTTNLLTMNTYRAELAENYQPPDQVWPGSTVTKEVNVSNTGNVDCFVRVRFTKAFGTRAEDGTFLPDDSLDTKVIELTCNDTFWMEMDGFWYYKDVLKAGETTREPLFESFHISESAGNEYFGKEAEIFVNMESVQAEGNALELWGISRQILGISESISETEQEACVEYRSRGEGFVFTGLGTDLFTSFKNLLPGCARTQQIMLINSSGESVDLYLHAQAAQQEGISEEQLMLIQKLLTEYAQIQICREDQILYSGPVDGNLTGTTGIRMDEAGKLYLGTLAAGEERSLTVTLQLSPEMENEYQSLTGKVDWVFTAQGEDSAAASVPKTGDDTELLIPVICFWTSALLLISAAVSWRKRHHEEY